MTFSIFKFFIGFLICVSVDCQPRYVLENDHGRIFLEEIVDKGSGVIHFISKQISVIISTIL